MLHHKPPWQNGDSFFHIFFSRLIGLGKGVYSAGIAEHRVWIEVCGTEGVQSLKGKELEEGIASYNQHQN